MPERTIKHLGFWYMVEMDDLRHPGQTYWIEKTAAQNETVDIAREDDVSRGEDLGAFYTDDELEEGAHLPQEEEVVVQEQEVDSIRDLTDDELLAWIHEDKPTAREVVDAAEGDPTLANRLLEAEDKASDGNSRRSVVQGLTAVVNQGA